jgi:hypothetical protein
MRMSKVWVRQHSMDQYQRLTLRKMNNGVKKLKLVFCLAHNRLESLKQEIYQE